MLYILMLYTLMFNFLVAGLNGIKSLPSMNQSNSAHIEQLLKRNQTCTTQEFISKCGNQLSIVNKWLLVQTTK
jgi:hypothetical protein